MGRLVILAVAMFVLATGMSAQSTIHGAIGGTVRDPSGSVVPAASVSALNLGTNSKVSANADANGRFIVSGLQPGAYRLEVNVSGFSTFQQENVIVEVGRVTSVDVNLSLATQKATVIAVAEAPVITTTSPELTSNINQLFINNLPSNLRRWSFFALSTPGATPDGNFGLVSFRGISGLLNNNTVDGGDNNQAFFAEEKGRTRISYSTSISAIQEFQVNTSNYSSEYGRSAGGVVNAVTKSGSNQFHGEAFWHFRNSDWGAFNPFQTVTNLVGGVAVTTPVKPKDKRHQFGGAIGGPIVKDKLFFFFSADQQKRNFPGVANASDPKNFFLALSASELATLSGRGITAVQAGAAIAFLQSLTGVVPRTGDQLILFPKLDWTINDKHHFSTSFNRMRWASPAGIQTQPIVFRGKESFGSDFVKGDSLKIRLDSTLTQKIVNQFRFQYGRDFEFQNSQPSIAGEPVSSQGVSPEISISGSSGIAFGKPNFLERRAFPDEKNYQYSDTISLAHGSHFLRLGVDINRVHDLLDNLFREGGTYSYSNRVQFISDYVAAVNAFPTPVCLSGATAVPCYTTVAQGFGPTAFKFGTIDYGAFVQDDWRVSSRFTFNLGLRYEYQKLPRPQIPNPILPQSGVFPSDRNNFGPRLGVAWDLTGRGKTVIRGGYGIYYGRIINSTISNAITNSGSALGQLQFSFSPTSSGRPLYPNVGVTPPPPGATPPDVVVFAKSLQNPLIHQYDVVFEHQISTNTAFSVSYIGSLGRDLPVFLDANLFPPTANITYTISGGPRSGQAVTFPLFTGPRPNTSFSRITTISDKVRSKYNALVLQLNRRMTRGLQYQIFYTGAKSTDNGQSSQTFTTGNNVLNVFDLSQEQGRSNFDVRHRIGASAIWEPEYFRNSGPAVRVFLSDWAISTVIAASYGAPYTGFVSGNVPTSPGTPCPTVLIQNFTCASVNGAGGSNRPPFEIRNAYEMPRTINVDLRVSKKFHIVERFKLELFGDFFNLANHVNITSVGSTLYRTGGTGLAPTLTYDTSFGVRTASSNTLVAQRQIQVGAKLHW
jgi:outer membrane receptor protein involved in Fe transport